MKIIAVTVIDGKNAPSEPIPDTAISVKFDGVNYTAYEAGDELPPKPESAPNPNADILAQIAALEASVTERRLQGALGGNAADIAWMANLESQKAALRAQLVK